MYSAPDIIIKLNIISDVDMITPKPKMQKSTWTIMPDPIPILVNMEIFLP